eukprot:jgi/Ulvmu1/4833/UM020_0119.1
MYSLDLCGANSCSNDQERISVPLPHQLRSHSICKRAEAVQCEHVHAMGAVGVLALQGSFREHIVTLSRCGVTSKEVRTAEELRTCDGLIIPGGESTTMAHVANTNGLLNELRDFVITQRKPVWGTCAGLIFLAESAEGAKQGGQTLLQCMAVHVSRNFFGSQIASFEQQLPAHEDLLNYGGDSTYRAVFIRAPAILSVDKEHVKVLSEYTLTPEEQQRAGRESVVVAARSGNMLVTAFHPELTEDTRWHQLFVDMVRQGGKVEAFSGAATSEHDNSIRPPNIPADLPVFGSVHPCA